MCYNLIGQRCVLHKEWFFLESSLVLQCNFRSLVFFGRRISHPSFCTSFYLSIYLCVVSNQKKKKDGPIIPATDSMSMGIRNVCHTCIGSLSIHCTLVGQKRLSMLTCTIKMVIQDVVMMQPFNDEVARWMDEDT